MLGVSKMKERFYSLDLLRGMDMFLLVMVGGPMRSIQGSFHCFPDSVWRNFSHGWTGFGFWDIIMPLFIFICGAAMPFSIEKRLAEGRATWGYWRHVLGRVALLWIFGMVAQGQLLTFDLMKISPYNNTLQAIAAGYLIAALTLCVRSAVFRIALPVTLAFAYAGLLALLGDYSKTGNFANIVEMKMLAALLPDGSSAFQTWNYTWFLTSMMFGSMTLCGYHSTKILQGAGTQWRKAFRLGMLAVALLAVGWASSCWIPVIKPIYTLSFTSLAMGWCVLSLTALYVLADILRFRRGFWVFMLLGRHSLFAYMTGCFLCVFAAASDKLFGGLSIWIGQAAMPVILSFSNSALRLGSVWVWDRLRKGKVQ